ncbi:MAG TPA: LysM domain-containing protein [Egicoccus sp.]|nr:LysM domain-containing protein [Egicoccus sp.]HSK25028.1 LysM domain-containing protein [Egicoccus sp.]
MTRARSTTALFAWTTALAVGIAAFHDLGGHSMPAPPWQPDAFLGWLGATDPLLATMSLLRLLVLALSWYLVGVTAVGVVARLAGAVRLVRLADALTVPALRRLLQSALGVGLATAMVAAATPARAQPLPLQLLDGVAVETADTAASDAPERLPSPSHGVPVPVVADTVGDVDASPPPGQHIVVAGESFWRIAADHVAQASDRPAADAEVAMYWRRLIEQNRSRLADPGNPDLLYPGQRLDLPPVAG